MRLSLLAYCLGNLFPLVLPSLDFVVAGSGALLLVFAALYWRWLHHRRWLLLCLAATLGVLWHGLWAEARLAARLPAELEGQDLWLTGQVVNLPTRTGAATQFQFDVTDSIAALQGRRVLLNDYSAAEMITGQRWNLRVRLNRPHGFANPGGFDYEAWLLQQGIAAKGYVRTDSNNRLLGSETASLGVLRAVIRARLLEATTALPHQAIILALAVGDRSALTTEDWELMSASGTNHLFVISGLHIGLVWVAVYGLLSGLLRLWPGVSRYWPRQKWAASGALLAAFVYCLLAGFTLPTRRAFAMTAVFVLTQLGNRPVAVSLRFWLALALVLTLDPLAPITAGFWLSFGAVAALLLGLAGRSHLQTKRTDIAGRWLRPQLVVFVGLLPLLILWTGQVAVLAPAVNVLAIPLVGLLVVPLTLLAVVVLPMSGVVAGVLLLGADRLLGGLFFALDGLAEATAPWSLLTAPALSLTTLLFLLGAVVLLLAPLPWSRRWLVLPLTLPLLLPAPPSLAENTVQVHILDVGQGLAVIVQSRNHSLVYDTGARLSPEFSLGSAVVVPVLRQLGIREVDTVVVSHFDNDHAGGLVDLLAAVPVTRLISSDPGRAAAAIASNPVPHEICRDGQTWQWDGVTFRFLHPPSEPVSRGEENNGSCVLHVQFGTQRLLLPGDIEQEAEHRLAATYRQALGSDVLVAPHHGSNTSSTYAFVKAVAPDYVVYTAGYRNSFGHPTPRTRARYTDLGARDYLTHATGMLSFTLTGHGPLAPPTRYRETRRRYWY